jgi:transposase-like protein
VLLELTVVEQRFNAVMEVLRDGLKVIEVADRYRVSRQTVHGWLRRSAAGGLDTLADRSHRPDSCPHQMPPRSRHGSVNCAATIQVGASAA